MNMEDDEVNKKLRKRCPSCNEFKLATEEYFYKFPKAKRSRYGLSSYCRVCTNIKNRESYQKHKEKVLKRTAAYGKKNAWKYNYRSKNKNKIKTLFNLLKSKGKPICTFPQFQEWFEIQPNECYYCNISFKNQKRSIDRKDNSKGYLLDNIVLSCVPCNAAKGAKYSAEEFKKIGGVYMEYEEPKGDLTFDPGVTHSEADDNIMRFLNEYAKQLAELQEQVKPQHVDTWYMKGGERIYTDKSVLNIEIAKPAECHQCAHPDAKGIHTCGKDKPAVHEHDTNTKIGISEMMVCKCGALHVNGTWYVKEEES